MTILLSIWIIGYFWGISIPMLAILCVCKSTCAVLFAYPWLSMTFMTCKIFHNWSSDAQDTRNSGIASPTDSLFPLP